jgi:predicted nucleic acid-binding protein
MANNLKTSNEAASASADATCALCNSGYIRIYDGTQPATANTAITSQVLLAELRYGATAYAGAVNGVASLNAVTPDSDANATGTPSWFRALKSDGTSPVFDGSVGQADADMIIAAAQIVQHAEVSISSGSYTQPKSA